MSTWSPVRLNLPFWSQNNRNETEHTSKKQKEVRLMSLLIHPHRILTFPGCFRVSCYGLWNENGEKRLNMSKWTHLQVTPRNHPASPRRPSRWATTLYRAAESFPPPWTSVSLSSLHPWPWKCSCVPWERRMGVAKECMRVWVHMQQSSTNPIRDMLHGNGPQRDTVMYTHVSSVFVRVDVCVLCILPFVRFTQADLQQALHYALHLCTHRLPAERKKHTHIHCAFLADRPTVITPAVSLSQWSTGGKYD